MKKNFFIIFLFYFLINDSCIAQENIVIVIKNNMVYQDNVALFSCEKKKIDQWSDFYTLKSNDGKTQAELTMSKYGDKTMFNGRFTLLGYFYECYYPKTDIETILSSYIKNEVIKESKANLEGLKKYCNDRSMPLQKIPSAEELAKTKIPKDNPSSSSPNKPKSGSTNNNSSSASSLPKQVSFTLKNNSSKSVRIFIGTKPKYGSGRTYWLGGNNLASEYGTSGDQICIVDDHDNPISCQTLGDGTTRIDINSSGTGFGY